MLSKQMECDLKEIECRLIKAQRPAFDRIKTALAELGTTPNTGSPKLLGYITYALDALRWGDYESVEPYLVRASEQLRAGA